MKIGQRMHEIPSGRVLSVVLAMLFILCAGAASAAQEPGAITIVLPAEPQNIDPCDSLSSLTGPVIMRNIVEPLAELNPEDGKIIPRLATSWRQIDQTTWQFFLRKGVKFHDGKDFNAEAVVFNIKRMFDKRINSRVRTKFLANITFEAKVLDTLTVEIKTDKFEPLMLILMGTFAICSPDTPMDKWTRQPIGTGPYKFVRWDAGTQIVLERFDGYWGKQPQVKKATYIWRGESSVRAAMVEIGEADLVPSIAMQDAKRPDMDVAYLNAETTFLRFGGLWEPPLNDKRVRMALNYAIDRNAIRGSIISKDSIPASQMIAPSITGYNPELKPWSYDPQKAKQLLDEARKDGVPIDKEITLIGRSAYYPGSEELLEAVMTMYKAVGLNVKMRIYEVAVWQKNYRQKPYPTNIGPYIIQMQHDNNAGDAAFTFYYGYHCNGNVSVNCDKPLDELIEKAQVATGEERRKLWQAAFKRAQQEVVPDAMLFHMVAYCRVGKRITFKPSIVTNIEIPIATITFK